VSQEKQSHFLENILLNSSPSKYHPLSFFTDSNVNNVKMQFIESLCPPALLYLVYIAVQVGLDLSLGMWITSAVKIVAGIAGVVILDGFCDVDLGIVSWVIMAMPFVIVALGTSIAMGLQLDRTITTIAREHFTGKPSEVKAGEPPASTTSSY
jgi:hypothetical protein